MAPKRKITRSTDAQIKLLDYMLTVILYLLLGSLLAHSVLKNWTLLAEKGCTSLQQEGGVASAYLQALRQTNKLLKELIAENRLSNQSRRNKPKCSRRSPFYQK